MNIDRNTGKRPVEVDDKRDLLFGKSLSDLTWN
jgi:hypothetical protein